MLASRWLRSLRESGRDAVFRLFHQVLDSDDGRRMIRDALAGATVTGALPPQGPMPYADLPTAAHETGSRAPVFLTGRFRSGSTLLWNLFRHVPSCRAYYEPLNERRWFDPSTRGTRVDETHLGIDNYWREYEGLAHLGRWFQPAWNTRRLYMTPTDWDPDMAAYITALVDAAPERAVLKFNRVDFRLPWLRAEFPDARIIHIYRHPRDQWCSTLGSDSSFDKAGLARDFGKHDRYYLLAWADDLSARFPFLDPRSTVRPYELFYYLWKLSFVLGQAHAHASFCFESICESPAREVGRLMAAAGVSRYDESALIPLIAPKRTTWPKFAEREWFEEQEAHCETVLARFVSPPGSSRESFRPNSLSTVA